MVVKLVNPVQSSPIMTFNRDTSQPAAGTTIQVAGFGKQGNGEFPDFLQDITTQVVDFNTCAQSYATTMGEIPLVTDGTVFCAGDENQDACTGDAGGGAYDANNSTILYGLVSFGPEAGCAVPNLPGVYTDTSAFAEWIDAAVCTLSDFAPEGCTPLCVPRQSSLFWGQDKGGSTC